MPTSMFDAVSPPRFPSQANQGKTAVDVFKSAPLLLDDINPHGSHLRDWQFPNSDVFEVTVHLLFWKLRVLSSQFF